jgi:hypothetical protein
MTQDHVQQLSEQERRAHTIHAYALYPARTLAGWLYDVTVERDALRGQQHGFLASADVKADRRRIRDHAEDFCECEMDGDQPMQCVICKFIAEAVCP